MKFIPMLFSTPMVQAILEGRKTMTRRIANVPTGDHHGTDIMDWGLSEYPTLIDGEWQYRVQCDVDESDLFHLKTKYGKVGDIIWCRETFVKSGYDERYFYKADMQTEEELCHHKWKPSLFMPKAACRILLEITDVKVERLNSISEEDCIKEGIKPMLAGDDIYPKNKLYENYLKEGYAEVPPKDSFQSLWQSINGIESWNENKFVWCVSFKRIDKPKNFN